MVSSWSVSGSSPVLMWLVTTMGLTRICFLVLVVFGFNVSGQLQDRKCDFENGICKFLSNDENNIVNWELGKGHMNNSGETGPAVDHTYGTSNGYYLYVDNSKAKTGTVRLNTDVLLLDTCVHFFYHMYGADIGEFTVNAQSVYRSNSVQYFYRSGTQGDRWKEAKFTVSRTQEMQYQGFRINFVAKGKYSSTDWGDIALDDIELTAGKCLDTKHDAFDLCAFDDYDCGYITDSRSYQKWYWKAQGSYDTYYYINGKPKDHTLGTAIGGYWMVGDNGNSRWLSNGFMKTPVYEKPKTSQNCLHFYIYMEHESSYYYETVYELYVQVFLNFPTSDTDKKWLVTKAKNTTANKEWTYVEAKAEITEQFEIQFYVGVQSTAQVIAAIDDVKLIAGKCPEAGFCNFEVDKCNWVDGEGDHNWIRFSRKTSSWFEPGPNIDHTLGQYDGYYLILTSTSKRTGSNAILKSEIFPPSQDNYCIKFFYNIRGKNFGSLKVNVKQENFTESSIWLLENEGSEEKWKQGTAPLKPSLMYTQIVFEGIIGTDASYVALDDIRIQKGEKCVVSPAIANPTNEAIEKLTCSFDDKTLCSWIQDNETLSWKFGDGSPFDSTGPKEPLNGRGNYLFISSYEGTESNNEKIARIISPTVSTPYPSPICFSFYYHMFGAHVGQLRAYFVLMKDEKTPIEKQVIWRRRGTQPDKWIQFKDTLNATVGDYRIEIEAEGGPGFAGDIAIDDINLSEGECQNMDLCDFESSLCGWTIEGKNSDNYYWERGVKMPAGPTYDHTTMTEAGYYLQAVAEKGSKVEDKTNLVSPTYNSRWGPHCLTFWYWRPGYGVGKLSVSTRIGGKEHLEWDATSDVGKSWHFGQVTISKKEELQMSRRSKITCAKKVYFLFQRHF